MHQHDDRRQMLRTAGAAAHCNCSESKLEKARVIGDGPVFIKLGRTVVYDVTDLDDWLAANRRTSTSDSGTLPVPERRSDNDRPLPLRPLSTATRRGAP